MAINFYHYSFQSGCFPGLADTKTGSTGMKGTY